MTDVSSVVFFAAVPLAATITLEAAVVALTAFLILDMPAAAETGGLLVSVLGSYLSFSPTKSIKLAPLDSSLGARKTFIFFFYASMSVIWLFSPPRVSLYCIVKPIGSLSGAGSAVGVTFAEVSVAAALVALATASAAFPTFEAVSAAALVILGAVSAFLAGFAAGALSALASGLAFST